MVSSRPEGRYVAACGDFGLVMKAYFDKMESNGISVMAAILLVDNHALTARLRIKNTTEGCTHYVVSVYDPNVTNDKIRIMSESKEDIKHYSLMDFMNVDYSLLKWSNDHIINQSVAIIPALPKEQLLMLKGSVDEITPPLSPATMNLLMAIGQNHQLTQLMIQLQKMPELHRTEMLTAYNSGHMNVINTIFNALPTLLIRLNSIKNMKPLLLANNSNEYPGLFSAIQHKQQNVVETVYLALSDHARLFGFTAEDIMDFWQHKAPQKYSAFELAFELGHRVIAELILNTLNKMAESFGFTDNPRYIAEKNYMEALLKKHLPIPYAKSLPAPIRINIFHMPFTYAVL
ncbi:ShET2/EspL2 family type III secretion system effector toxin [Escherichia coli]|nr:ShET2/EspL2 family type III secretion system effector toxin [Escherichia coli]